ncbi:MAG TPA: hypothetical protein PKN48_00230 [Bacteroidales bacterium]|nr:hypothetical protein [Bacteroidales bacterium]
MNDFEVGKYYSGILLDKTRFNTPGAFSQLTNSGAKLTYLRRLTPHIGHRILVKFNGDSFEFNKVFIHPEWLTDLDRTNVASGDLDD